MNTGLATTDVVQRGSRREKGSCATVLSATSFRRPPRDGGGNIDPDPAMFRDMMGAFLEGRVYPSLAEAIKTQELLETCARLASEQNS